MISIRKKPIPTTALGLALHGSRLDGVLVKRSNGSMQVLKSFSATLTLSPLTGDAELVGREIRNHLDQAGIRISQIYLSHGHWDHLSGVRDFPEATVHLPDSERRYLQTDRPPRVLPSIGQDPAIRWQTLHFDATPYRGFSHSHDVFGDGSVVLVPTPGHTPGATAMYVNLSTEHRLLLVGDAVWRVREAQDSSRKAWPVRWFADQDRSQTDATIQRIAAAMAEPGTIVIPTHDLEVQQKLGFFPAWIK